MGGDLLRDDIGVAEGHTKGEIYVDAARRRGPSVMLVGRRFDARRSASVRAAARARARPSSFAASNSRTSTRFTASRKRA